MQTPVHPDERMQSLDVWTEQAGFSVRFEVDSNARVVMTIYETDGSQWPGKIVAAVSFSSFRRERIARLVDDGRLSTAERRLEQHAIPALKMAYYKHVLGGDSIGWKELEDTLSTSLQECLDDAGFQAWLKEIEPR